MANHHDSHSASNEPPSPQTSIPVQRIPSPLRHTPKHLRPYVQAIMIFKNGQPFETKPSAQRNRRLSQAIEKEGKFAAALTALYVGVSAVFNDDNTAVVAIAIHDSVYLLDYSVQTLELKDTLTRGEDLISDHVIKSLKDYEEENLAKFIGAGIPYGLMKKSPMLCSRLWLELDVVPISIMLASGTLVDMTNTGMCIGPEVETRDDVSDKHYWDTKCVDEQADSMARKCIMYFGPNLTPILQVGYRGIVEIDSGFRANILRLQNFQGICGPTTWKAMMKFVDSLKAKGIKIAFFSSTPQGGGVALMRHALVRLSKLLGVNLTWYVPKPRPGVFRITKNVHNILQGVSKPGERISAADKKILKEWIEDNATRYWLSPGGPLRPPEEGGADVIMVDDPQMPGLIPLIKKITPNRPVLYRSHIQIRSDLVAEEETPQADIWEFLWSNIKLADMFISHPIPSFVPHNVPQSKVGYLPATTDFLDGLNKELSEWDLGYYGHIYNDHCHSMRMTELQWPARKYIIQEARFDPAKGIPDVLESYAEFRRLLSKHSPNAEAPQLAICGNGSVDDPDGTIILDETISHMEKSFPDLIKDISVMRLCSNDQLLNTLLSSSHTVLQLSTREGFEVKVSEAIHKGKPVIATRTGGIPLQVQHEKNGFLVEPGDWRAVAGHLLELWTDEGKYKRMCEFAKGSVSDEVGTVGNAMAWYYLADQWASGKGVVPNGKWINDLAREEASVPYQKGENRLPRAI